MFNYINYKMSKLPFQKSRKIIAVTLDASSSHSPSLVHPATQFFLPFQSPKSDSSLHCFQFSSPSRHPPSDTCTALQQTYLGLHLFITITWCPPQFFLVKLSSQHCLRDFLTHRDWIHCLAGTIRLLLSDLSPTPCHLRTHSATVGSYLPITGLCAFCSCCQECSFFIFFLTSLGYDL